MEELKTRKTCPGCGSEMEDIRDEDTNALLWQECPNPNCDWFEDDD